MKTKTRAKPRFSEQILLCDVFKVLNVELIYCIIIIHYILLNNTVNCQMMHCYVRLRAIMNN